MRLNWPEFFKRKNAQDVTPRAPDIARELRLGAEAQALYDSPAYQRAMERMRIQIHEAWAAAPLADRDGQHELLLTLKVLDGLEKQIKDESDSGKIAKRQLEIEAQRKAA